MGSKAWLSQVDPKTSLCLDLVRGTRHCHVYRCVVFNFLVSLVAADLGMPSPLTTASLLPSRFPRVAVYLRMPSSSPFLSFSSVSSFLSRQARDLTFIFPRPYKNSLLLFNNFYNLRFFLHRGIKLRT